MNILFTGVPSNPLFGGHIYFPFSSSRFEAIFDELEAVSLSEETFIPNTSTSPLVGLSKSAIILRSVVLPAPEGPCTVSTLFSILPFLLYKIWSFHSID